jgi:hypothetical protein
MSRAKADIKKGDLVEYDDVLCRVLRRREVTPLTMFQTSDYEVCLEAVDGEQVGRLPENEVTKVGKG